MPLPIPLTPQSVAIVAPRELVFQMLTAFRRGRLAGDNAESTRLISEEGNVKFVEFHTKSGRFTYRTVERVTLFPPERIEFEHLEGPLTFSEEAFTLTETPDGSTLLTHTGSFIWKPIPILGWLAGVLYVRPIYHRAIRDHFAAIKPAAEARAKRSHVFRSERERLTTK